MDAATQFGPGDRVVHPLRREWGEGEVRKAVNIMHQGAAAQRLEVQFRHKGLVTVNTGVARLISAKEGAMKQEPTMSVAVTHRPATASLGKDGWLGSLNADKPAESVLWALPEAMTDPFASPKRRLVATLQSYRFHDAMSNPRSLLEWAMQQTGADDPLSQFTRQDLEQAFPRFQRDRDHHLQDMVHQLKRKGEIALLREAAEAVKQIPAARDLLERLMRR